MNGTRFADVSVTGWPVLEHLNQARTRDLNEATERASVALGSDGGRERFACECGDSGCTSVICLTKVEYETVRASPTQFAIRRDHENPECEFVVYENDRWAVVQAVGREAVMAARRSDPRSGGSGERDVPGKTATAEPGARRTMTFVVYEDDSHQWRWQLVSHRGHALADSAKSYTHEGNALEAVHRIQKSIVGARVETRG